jgi:hypothetical protein
MKSHTDLDLAIQEAQRTDRPILSLALLGRLDEALSCANSRFFKLTLYPDPQIARRMNERFVLHWASVRPVPKVTIDFGDGRVVERTVTGNSAHLVLDPRGAVVEAIPGLYAPRAFGVALDRAARAPSEPAAFLAYHRACRERIDAARLDRPGAAVELSAESQRLLRERLPTAREAGALARTKLRVEDPLLGLLTTLGASIAEDSWLNEHQLHRRIHQAFIDREAPRDREGFVDWLYRTVFLMPLDDPWLGLRSDPLAEL